MSIVKTYDTHAHLDQLEDLDTALHEAHQAGVLGIVNISMDLHSCQKNLEIKKKHAQPAIYIGFGMHPSETNLNDLEKIVELIYLHKGKLHVIGEIGLDFWYKWVRKDDQKKDEQRRVFSRLLDVARDLDLPAVIHSRGAWKECLSMAKAAGVKKAEFHWYSGPLDVLQEIIEAGYYVSTTPSLAYSPQSREAISHAPIERTLIETDAPVFYRSGEANEGFKAGPKDVFRTLRAYCDLKDIKPEKAVEIFNRNAVEFFSLN